MSTFRMWVHQVQNLREYTFANNIYILDMPENASILPDIKYNKFMN